MGKKRFVFGPPQKHSGIWGALVKTKNFGKGGKFLGKKKGVIGKVLFPNGGPYCGRGKCFQNPPLLSGKSEGEFGEKFGRGLTLYPKFSPNSEKFKGPWPRPAQDP